LDRPAVEVLDGNLVLLFGHCELLRSGARACSTPLGYRTAPMLPRGVYAIVDGSAGRPPLELVAAFVRGGAAVVQLRLKGAAAGEVLGVARGARQLCEGKALLLINDRADVAKLAQADGVHLGQDDLPIGAARALLGPEALIGISTHSDAEIDQADGADYVAFGP